jgi:hypothetical protein
VLPDLRLPLIRQLTESDAPRHHWHGEDGKGGVWLFETVRGDGGEHWAIRQVEIDALREPHRYWSAHLQDEYGFLTDQAVEIWDLTEITGETFEAVWQASAGLTP